MKKEDKDKIKEILAKQAVNAANKLGGTAGYFVSLVKQADLPSNWIAGLLVWSGVPKVDALNLINYALGQGTNPKDERFDTLGSFLQVILDDLGLEDQRTLVAIIVAYRLYHDQKLLDGLAARYQIPVPATKEGAASETGPTFVWRGPADDVELQSWLQPEPSFYDVGFLKRGIERAAGVCRIELPDGRTGTGFLVAADLLLTNYHVFKDPRLLNDDLEDNVGKAKFHFGCVSAAVGGEATGQTVTAATKVPLSSSPVEELDYALLRLDSAVKSFEGVKPLAFDVRSPAVRTGLHILQHPGGKALMIALSTNGITGVYDSSGLFQYVTNAAGGSSGSPCFDDNWNVVGLHHAERSRAFGAIREGILFGSIHNLIQQYLSAA